MTALYERPSSHPALRGRQQALGPLTDALRRLIELSVTTTAGPGELQQVTALLEGAAERLAAGVPEVPVPRFIPRGQQDPAAEDPRSLHDAMPFDLVVGAYNPLAPPVVLQTDGDRAVGRARFTTAYEGAPGWVHGAAIAAAFDMVLTAANRMAGVAGPTVRLSMRYRRPTLLAKEAVFEGWIQERRERRVLTRGRLQQDGETTVEAEGEFMPIDPSMFETS